MISKVGVYKCPIDAYLSDFRGKATLPMLGGFMLQAATRHAEERGFGYSSMTDKKRAWVLTRMNIVIDEYPNNDTVIDVCTWVADVNKLFTERCFAFKNQEGKAIGYARSLWSAIDVETRRPTNIMDLDGLKDYISDEPCPIDPAGKIVQEKDLLYASSFEVLYSDIDINKHLSSMKYIEHFVNIFPLEIHSQKEICRIELNYIMEGHYGTKLDIYQKETGENVFLLEMKCDDKMICTSRITWKNIK